MTMVDKVNTLRSIITTRKADVLRKWLNAVYDAYPEDTSRFLKSERDMFANPVGHIVMTNAEFILDGLCRGEDNVALSPYIERIIRIRAVQDFTPEQAVSFFDPLQTAIITQLKPEIRQHDLQAELEELETSINDLTFTATDIYKRTKEKIGIIHMKELEKNRRFLQRMMGSCR